MLEEKDFYLLDEAVSRWGVNAQLGMAIEEMAELTKEICKEFRNGNNYTKIQEETADVLITVYQVARMVGMTAVDEQIDYKMRRLKQKLSE